MSGTVTTSVLNPHHPRGPRRGPFRVPSLSGAGVPFSRATTVAGIGPLLAAGLVVTSMASAAANGGPPISAEVPSAPLSWTALRSTPCLPLMSEERRCARDERRPPVAYAAAGPPPVRAPACLPDWPGDRILSRLPNDKSPRPVGVSRWIVSLESSGGSLLAVREPGPGRT